MEHTSVDIYNKLLLSHATPHKTYILCGVVSRHVISCKSLAGAFNFDPDRHIFIGALIIAIELLLNISQYEDIHKPNCWSSVGRTQIKTITDRHFIRYGVIDRQRNSGQVRRYYISVSKILNSTVCRKLYRSKKVSTLASPVLRSVNKSHDRQTCIRNEPQYVVCLIFITHLYYKAMKTDFIGPSMANNLQWQQSWRWRFSFDWDLCGECR